LSLFTGDISFEGGCGRRGRRVMSVITAAFIVQVTS